MILAQLLGIALLGCFWSGVTTGQEISESEELLERLLALRQLLYRLIGCKNAKESFKIYCLVNDGIINLVDKDEFKFFKCQQVVLHADGYTAPYTRRCSLEE
ncbi:hypothetical protein K1719_046027 [Acacia pycnantha]|nr:hypothetical protein K1719_046027 [Acacia pycnantha]